MSIFTEYRSKLRTPEEAVRVVKSGAKGEKAQDGISGADVQTGNIENVQKDNSALAQNIQPVEIAAPETPVAQVTVYTHVDVRL